MNGSPAASPPRKTKPGPLQRHNRRKLSARWFRGAAQRTGTGPYLLERRRVASDDFLRASIHPARGGERMSLSQLDPWVERHRDAVLLASRFLLAAIFIASGFGKLTHFSGFADSLGAKGLPLPLIWALAGVAVEFLGGLCILVGLWTRAAALLMLLFTATAALISHQFWAADAAHYQGQYVNFMKNVAIMGGFLALFMAGPGSLSLDKLLFGHR